MSCIFTNLSWQILYWFYGHEEFKDLRDPCFQQVSLGNLQSGLLQDWSTCA